MTPLGQLPLRRALNLAYARLVAGRSQEQRDRIDEALAWDPAADRRRRLREQSAAFALRNGGDIG